MFKKNKHGIQMKTPEQLEKMRAAGLVVGRTLQLLRESVHRPGTLSRSNCRVRPTTGRPAGRIFSSCSGTLHPDSVLVLLEHVHTPWG